MKEELKNFVDDKWIALRDFYSFSSSSGLLLYTPRCFKRDRSRALFSCFVSISRR